MSETLRTLIRREAEAVLDKALRRARREALQGLRRAALGLAAGVLAVFSAAFAFLAAYLALIPHLGAPTAAAAVAALTAAFAAVSFGFAVVSGRAMREEDAPASSASQELASQERALPRKEASAKDGIEGSIDHGTAEKTPEREAGETLAAVMTAASRDLKSDAARAVVREGARFAPALTGTQLALAAAATGFLYARHADRRPRRPLGDPPDA